MKASQNKVSNPEPDPRLDAAQKRLCESVDQADAIEAVREIVTNLLGCEEIALFTIGDGKHQPESRLLWSFGIDPEQHRTLDVFAEPALPRVLRGELQVVKTTRHESQRAFVPIALHGRTAAVLVLLKLLPQKVGFDQADINLVQLISSEAGKPLFERSANAHA